MTSAVRRSRDLSTRPKPGGGEKRRAIARREVPGLLPVRGVTPFVIAGHRNKAAGAFERIAEDRFRLDSLCSRIERRHPQFFEWLAPPPGHEAPAHGDKLALALLRGHHVYRICRAHVVADCAAARPSSADRARRAQPRSP